MFRARRRAMLCHQTINASVMTWQANAPPANWTRLRDEWWRWHHDETRLDSL